MSDKKKPTEREATELGEDQLEQVTGGSDGHTESVAFAFSTVEMMQKPTDDDRGKGGGKIRGGYDLTQSKP